MLSQHFTCRSEDITSWDLELNETKAAKNLNQETNPCVWREETELDSSSMKHKAHLLAECILLMIAKSPQWMESIAQFPLTKMSRHTPHHIKHSKPALLSDSEFMFYVARFLFCGKHKYLYYTIPCGPLVDSPSQLIIGSLCRSILTHWQIITGNTFIRKRRNSILSRSFSAQ